MSNHRIHQHAQARRWITAMSLLFLHCSLFISSAAAQLRVEYFFDTDPGRRQATWVNVVPDADGNISFNAPTDGLTPGNHLLGIRAYQDGLTEDDEPLTLFGPTIIQKIFVPKSEDWLNITRLEYFWDSDPGFGKGTAIEIMPDMAIDLDNIEIPTDGLPSGNHLLGLRAYGALGWSPSVTQQVYVAPKTSNGTDISRIEYFWDSDPGYGNGTPITITLGQEVNLENLEIPTEGLSMGEHHLFIRTFGHIGWSPTMAFTVIVPPNEANQQITAVEYFWDEDPGYGKATPFTITPGLKVDIDKVEISTEGLSQGDHSLFIRSFGYDGWSPTIQTNVRVLPMDADFVVNDAEYFWNEDPGFGNGTPIALTPGENLSLEDFQIPSSTVHGDAVLFIRYRGPLGWSPTMAYPVMVDAEGNYTLNANAVTSMETRNYQSLNDVVDDFSDRGVGNNITLTLPTTNTDYQLDATADGKLAQLVAISESIEQRCTFREGKSIGFKATEDSGNTLTVTTTDEGLSTVLAFFAHTWLENVTLTINGQAYNFSSWATIPHSEEVCSGEENTPVSINAPMTGMTVSFTSQPYNGTALSGYATETSTTLSAMTIQNSSAKLDSVAYRVALSDGQGTEVSSFTYYIYVRPLVGKQQFSGMLPVTDSSLDPGKTILKWNAVPAAESYRLTVTDADDAIIDGFPVETDKTSYELTVVSGQHYKWQVVAVGPCDELTSPTMTFEGRLLPDLAVTAIVLPEAAEAGNTITVMATVTNQGEGATTENQWTDRIYYVVNSTDFQQAVQAAEVTHTGNLAVGAYYDVSFTMQAPYLEEGQLYVFVETDVTGKAMETNDDNNRLCSSSPAQLQPFYMNTTDLAALRQLYADFGGDQWNGTKWNTASELITEGNWSGITFNSEGRVTAINLQGRGLCGVLNVPTLEAMQCLTSLNLSSNSIGALTDPLPSTLTTVNLSNQDIETSVSLSGLLEQSGDLTTLLPNIVTYQAGSRTFGFDGYFQLTNTCEGGNQTWRMNIGNGLLQQVANPTVVYNEESGHQVRMRVYNGNVWNDMRLLIDYDSGDANLDGLRNVADLQHLINYAVNDTHRKVFFNFKGADLQPDGSANVLDVVKLVNLLLADNPVSVAARRRAAIQSDETVAEASLFVRGHELVLVTSRPVAAFDITLRVSNGANVQWMPDDDSWQLSQNTVGTAVHAIVYSLTGRTLPAGETVVARIDGGSVSIGSAMLVDTEAQEVTTRTSIHTAIVQPSVSDSNGEVYSVDGIKRDTDIRHKGLRIVNGKKKMVK